MSNTEKENPDSIKSEKCILCGKDTGIPFNEPIDKRKYYIRLNCNIKKQTAVGKTQKAKSLISKSLPVTKMRVFFGNPVVLMNFRQSAS